MERSPARAQNKAEQYHAKNKTKPGRQARGKARQSTGARRRQVYPHTGHILNKADGASIPRSHLIAPEMARKVLLLSAAPSRDPATRPASLLSRSRIFAQRAASGSEGFARCRRKERRARRGPNSLVGPEVGLPRNRLVGRRLSPASHARTVRKQSPGSVPGPMVRFGGDVAPRRAASLYLVKCRE